MNRVLEEFYEITKIPRPSGKEDKMRDYLYEWAKEKGIHVETDDYKNVFMIKPATSGYEGYKSVALQAHIDMVCEKAEGVEHNFDKDSIKYYIDEDTVSTHGKTTLGADNGLGIATILSILSDDKLHHPRLEAIFTSDEEADFTGADNFDVDKMQSEFLINLDHCNDNEILCASAGGITVTATKTLSFVEVDENYKSFNIIVSGLKGGHSGEDIHRGRGNSNRILFRLLDFIEDVDFYMNDILGGSFRLAIPRKSVATLWVLSFDYDRFIQKIDEFNNIISEEFQGYNGDVKVSVEEIKVKEHIGIDKKIYEDIRDYIFVSPINIQIMSNVFENLVDCSCNLGEIFIKENKFEIVSDIRASFDSQKEFIVKKLTKLAKVYGLDYHIWSNYYSWKYKDNSKLRELVEKIYEKNNQKKPMVLAVHGGLECGFFSVKKPSLDIVSIGPNSWNFHSPSEGFSIKSVNIFYDNIVEILENAKF